MATLAMLLALGSSLPAAAADFANNFGATAGANIIPTATTVDTNGNVFIAGNFDGATATLGNQTLRRIGGQDAFVAKLDTSGTVLWVRSFGGSGASASANGIAVDASGNVYLAGHFNGANLTTPALTKVGNQEAFVFKLDAVGNTTWAKHYGGSGADAIAIGIAIDGPGNVYLGGIFAYANLTTPALTKIGSLDAFVFKLDASGNTTWAKNYGGSGAEARAKGIAVDVSGNVYLGGRFNANLTTPALNMIGYQDAFAFKLDAAGNTTWAKNYGGSGAYATANGIAIDAFGSVYLGGDFSYANLTTPALTKIGNQDAFAFKLDTSGNTTWAQNYGGSETSAQANGIAVDASGSVYLGGDFRGPNLTNPALIGSSYQEAFAFKIDAGGKNMWAKNFGGIGALASATGIAVDVSGNVYVGGHLGYGNVSTPPLTTIGNQDAFVFKLDSGGNSTWQKNYGALMPGGSVFVSATAVDAAGNTYLGGYFLGATFTLGSVTLNRIGGQDAFAAKLDPSGTVLWAKNYGGSAGAAAFATSIAVDVSGNAYLGGYFGYINLTTPALTTIGNQDAFAFKLDSAGNTVWAKNYGGAGVTTYATCITADASGNVYLGGYFNADLTNPALTKIGNSDPDAFAFKLDAAGNILWAKNYGGSAAATFATSIAVDASGKVYLGGNFNASLTTPALTAFGGSDAFAFKLDAAGNTTWARNYGGIGALASATGIAVDASGQVYLGGYFGYANLTTPALTKIGNPDAFAFKLDAAGNTTWAKNYGGSGAIVYANHIALDASSNVYLGGDFTYANLTTPALAAIGPRDAFALKLDTAGNTTWAKNYGGSGALASALGVAVDAPGNVYLGGVFHGASLTTPALTRIGNEDAFIIKQKAAYPVRSRKTHGAAGDFDLTIDPDQPITDAVTVEPRLVGSGHTIVFQFPGPITVAGTASVTPVGTAMATSVNNEVHVTLTNIPDNQRVMVTLVNVNGTVNPPPVSVGFLVGDVNNSRSINASDISGVKAHFGQSVTKPAANFRFDLNASGSIDSSDISAVKARAGLVLP